MFSNEGNVVDVKIRPADFEMIVFAIRLKDLRKYGILIATELELRH